MSYERSGGITGITVAAEAGAGDLPDGVVSIAAGLLGSSSDVGNQTEKALTVSNPTPAPDQFTHALEVSRGGERRAFQWSDATMPEEVRPLLDTLARRSEPI